MDQLISHSVSQSINQDMADACYESDQMLLLLVGSEESKTPGISKERLLLLCYVYSLAGVVTPTAGRIFVIRYVHYSIKQL